MKRRGFTLIELLVVIAIIGVVVAIVFAATGHDTPNPNLEGTVVNKFVDLDYDNNNHYRIQVEYPDGSIQMFNSNYIHNDVHIGHKYRFENSRMFGLQKAEEIK